MDRLLDMRLDGVTFDHLASLYEEYTGKIALENGKGTMTDFKYVDGASVLPDAAATKKLRPAVE